jgi:serine/threonine protein kinase
VSDLYAMTTQSCSSVPKGQLKILDFGRATLPTRPPVVPGSEIWATGAVMYMMATGRLPFPEKQKPQLNDEILREPVTPPGRASIAGLLPGENRWRLVLVPSVRQIASSRNPNLGRYAK